MKPFKYTLQAVRTLREQQEQAALHDFGLALRAAEQAAEKLAAVLHELEAVWAEVQNSFATQATAEDFARLQGYCQTVERRRAECDRALEVARHNVRESFVKLVAARQAAAVLEKHFETQKRHHDHAQRRREQKILDDLAGRQNRLRATPSVRPGSTWN